MTTPVDNHVAVLAADNLVAPPTLLVVYSLLALVVIAAGIATAVKGRWGWLLVGALTGGLAWLYSAFLPPAPGSIAARRG